MCGATACQLCPVGKSDADLDPATPCTDCEIGHHIILTDTGITICTVCPAGTADLDRDSASACNQCPNGTYSSTGSFLCVACGAGRLDHDQNSSTACIAENSIALAAEITLALDVEQVVEGTEAAMQFELAFRRDMAAALSVAGQIVDADQIQVTSVVGGSARVSFLVRPSENGMALTSHSRECNRTDRSEHDQS